MHRMFGSLMRAYHIGPPAARESYLVAEKIIEVAKKSGAGAIHPGYGFLAERADFAQACYDNDIVFVGPAPHAITNNGRQAIGPRNSKKGRGSARAWHLARSYR